MTTEGIIIKDQQRAKNWLVADVELVRRHSDPLGFKITDCGEDKSSDFFADIYLCTEP